VLDLILLLLNSLLTGLRGQAALQTEIIALRHQLTVLQRTHKPERIALNARPLPVGLVVTIVVGLAFRSDHGQA